MGLSPIFRGNVGVKYNISRSGNGVYSIDTPGRGGGVKKDGVGVIPVDIGCDSDDLGLFRWRWGVLLNGDEVRRGQESRGVRVGSIGGGWGVGILCNVNRDTDTDMHIDKLRLNKVFGEGVYTLYTIDGDTIDRGV